MPKEYIDRQALTEEILSLSIINNYVAAYADTVLERIQRAPTIDPTHAGGCWISVKDRMPENDLPSSAKQIKVITFIKGKNGYTVRSQLRRKGYYDEWVWKYAAGDVTHWMPLPEPPAESRV